MTLHISQANQLTVLISAAAIVTLFVVYVIANERKLKRG